MVSRAVAYWSIRPLTGPRLLSVSQAYAERMQSLPRLENVVGIAPTTGANPQLESAAKD